MRVVNGKGLMDNISICIHAKSGSIKTESSLHYYALTSHVNMKIYGQIFENMPNLNLLAIGQNLIRTAINIMTCNAGQNNSNPLFHTMQFKHSKKFTLDAPSKYFGIGHPQTCLA